MCLFDGRYVQVLLDKMDDIRRSFWPRYIGSRKLCFSDVCKQIVTHDLARVVHIEQETVAPYWMDWNNGWYHVQTSGFIMIEQITNLSSHWIKDDPCDGRWFDQARTDAFQVYGCFHSIRYTKQFDTDINKTSTKLQLCRSRMSTQ